MKREEKQEEEHKGVGGLGKGVQETGEEGKEPEGRGAGKGQGQKTVPEYREGGRRTGSP